MAVINIFNAAYVRAEEVAAGVASELGLTTMRDAEVFAMAAERFGMSESRLAKTVYGKPSVFNSFTHERERAVTCLRATLAELLHRDDLLLYGWAGLLVPQRVSHVLRVLLGAEVHYRAGLAAEREGVSAEEGAKLVHKADEALFGWSEYVTGAKAWDNELYDVVIPMDAKSVEHAVAFTVDNARRGVLVPTAQSQQAVDDFALAARVDMALVKEGHSVDVEAKNGRVQLTINKNVIMLSRLEEELQRIASGVEGVREVTTRVGKDFYQADIYRRHDFSLPSKVLLVDDEREFVETLSERLTMRDVGSAVVYDGPQALNLLQDEEPEVMILDLKMPGMDGLEVLRRVRRDHPGVAVIILTGHGSDKDRETCMDLGAFAYLQKPVDIDVLSSTVKSAYEKVRVSS
jgi:CheY-like chemotaxis protein